MRAEHAVLLWLEGLFDNVQENRVGFPDFIAERDGKTFGFEVKVVQNLRMILNRLRESTYRAYYELKENGFSEIAIVWIVSSPTEVEELKRMLARMTRDEMPDNLRMILGVFDDSATDGIGFLPYEDFACNEANPSFQRTAFGGR